MSLVSRRLVLLFAGACTVTPAPVDAADWQAGLVSRAGVLGPGANGDSAPASGRWWTGRYLLFASRAANAGDVVDTNNADDVFLRDTQLGTTIVVSRSALDPTRTANAASTPVAVTPDGRWVLFDSIADDLVPGQLPGVRGQTYLFDRQSGTTRLVSHVAGNPLQMPTDFGASGFAVSDDGSRVLFGSPSGQLASGVAASSGANAYMADLSVGTARLLSHAPGQPTQPVYAATPSGLSADGNIALFLAIPSAQSLQTNAWTYQYDSGTLTLVSSRFDDATAPVGSSRAVMSRSGRFVALRANPGFIAGSLGTDLYLVDRAGNARRRLFPNAPAPTQVVPDGPDEYRLAFVADDGSASIRANAGTLVPGVSDTNASLEALWVDPLGNATLVSRLGGSGNVAGGIQGIYDASDDGRCVVVRGSTDLVAGATPQFADAVVIIDRTAGTSRLAAHRFGATTVVPSDYVGRGAVATDCSFAFESDSWDIVSPQEPSSYRDLFFGSPGGEAALASVRVGVGVATSDGKSTEVRIATRLAAGGRAVAFTGTGHDVTVGYPVRAGIPTNVYVGDDATPALLLSPAQVPFVADATLSGFSPAGTHTLFNTGRSYQVPGTVDANDDSDAFLSAGEAIPALLSHRAGDALTAGNSRSGAIALSADARWHLIRSRATDLVSGFVDGNAEWADVFLHDATTGTTTLVSHRVSSVTQGATGRSEPVSMSADGRRVLFASAASDVIAGFVDRNGSDADDFYLYDRASGTTTLVSHRPGSAIEGANGGAPVGISDPIGSVSADGNWVLFASEATDLVAGQVDGNASSDLFLYSVATGQVTLVNHVVGNPTTTAGSSTWIGQISADGRYLAFECGGPGLFPGQDPNAPFRGVLLHDRATGQRRLVTHTFAGSTVPASFGMFGAMSADGRFIAWSTFATDVLAGLVDANERADTYVFDLIRDASTLVSHRAGAPLVAANGESLPQGISDDGRTVAFLSAATDLVAGVADGNAAVDAFLARDRDDLFGDGFED